MNFSTKAIHIGQEPDKTTGAIIPPIYQTSTYVQEEPGQFKGYDYTRAGNPNFTRLEIQLAALEQGKYATVFSSGLGATTALISTLQQGDRVIAINDLYGGTYRLFDRVFKKFGIIFELVDPNDADVLQKSLAMKPKMFILESPTNPLLKITDIAAVSKQTHNYGVTLVVDNTFASPYFQNPLALGADVVLHSTTKYIGGHSDVIGGAIITNNEELKKQLDFARMAIGLNPAPFDVWLTSRGLKTLALRMRAHQENALSLAQFLDQHEKVKKVHYPGLLDHVNHQVAKKQMHGFSGIVSAEFDLPLDAILRMISSYKIFALAESLGGVESLVDHPASMTHASIPKSAREKMGLPDGLVRFSVGIEDKDDILKDIRTGLNRV